MQIKRGWGEAEIMGYLSKTHKFILLLYQENSFSCPHGVKCYTLRLEV